MRLFGRSRHIDLSRPIDLSRYVHVISLGCNCQVTHQLRRITGEDGAQLLDWFVTPQAGALAACEGRVDGLLTEEATDLHPAGIPVDRATQIRFVHEAKSADSLAGMIAANAPRIAELKRRWHALLASSEPILFVRLRGPNELVGYTDPAGFIRAESRALSEALARSRPRAVSDLLFVMAEGDPVPASTPAIRYASVAPGETWHGNDSAWNALFRPPREAAFSRLKRFLGGSPPS
ncbi:hypothetical protein [Pseudoroseicyclus sp. CXY001]|uniref:hypothetical protein n=1 Tax=Pseudoroseicyclus sp. CXY001 TaxID=3242492 RepID=UPI0035714665